MLLIKTRSGARAFWCNTFLQNRRFSRFSYPMRFLTYPVDTILKESIFCSGWYLKYNKKAVIAQQSVPETGQKNWIIPRQHWGSRDTVISIAWSVLCMFFVCGVRSAETIYGFVCIRQLFSNTKSQHVIWRQCLVSTFNSVLLLHLNRWWICLSAWDSLQLFKMKFDLNEICGCFPGKQSVCVSCPVRNSTRSCQTEAYCLSDFVQSWNSFHVLTAALWAFYYMLGKIFP